LTLIDLDPMRYILQNFLKQRSFVMTLRLCCCALTLLFAFLTTNSQAADLEAGKKLVESRCSHCHGLDGISVSPVIPNHRGQKPLYFVKQLKAFKDGSRQDPLMNVQAANLNENDMENLAAYYSGLTCK